MAKKSILKRSKTTTPPAASSSSSISSRSATNNSYTKKRKKSPLHRFLRSKRAPPIGLEDDDDDDDDGGQTQSVRSDERSSASRSRPASSSSSSSWQGRRNSSSSARNAAAATVDDGTPSPSAYLDLQRVSKMIRDERHLAAYELYVNAKGRVEEARDNATPESDGMDRSQGTKRRTKVWWKGSSQEDGDGEKQSMRMKRARQDGVVKQEEDLGEDEKAWRCLQERQEEFQSLENRANLFKSAKENLCTGDDWIHAQTLFGVTTSYRREPNSSLSVKIEGELHGIPLFEQLVVLREADLYSHWAPFLSKSQKLAQLDKLDMVAWFLVGVPMFGLTRDAVYRAVGCDCMREEGGVLLVAVGLCDTEEDGVKNGLKDGAADDGDDASGNSSVDNCGGMEQRSEQQRPIAKSDSNLVDTKHSSFLARDEILSTLEIPPIPEGMGRGRMTIRNFAASIDILGPTAARTKMVVNVDPNLQLIPQFMIDFCMKRMCGILLSRLQAAARKVVKDPVTNPHARRMREDVRFYRDWLLPKFQSHCDEMGWDMPPVGAFEIEAGDLQAEGTGWIDDYVGPYGDDAEAGQDAASCLGVSSYAGTRAESTGGAASNPFGKLRKLVRRAESPEERIAGARLRAARLLQPKPFSRSKANRLYSLKLAKMRAEERIRANSDDSSVSAGSVSSYSTILCVPEVDVEGEVNRYVWILMITLTIHTILLLLRHYSFLNMIEWTSVPVQDSLDLLMIVLQSIALWALLNSVLIYSFDEIDFGQKRLVANMNFGKKLFVKEVKKYSRIVAIFEATVSCGYGLAAGSFHKVCSWGYFDVLSTFSQWWESMSQTILQKLLSKVNVSDDMANSIEKVFLTFTDVITTIYRYAWFAFSWTALNLSSCVRGALNKITTSSSTALTEIEIFVSSTHSRVCESTDRWGSRALDISSFVTLRLGVFVMALMLMGHLMLPKPEKKSRRKKAEKTDRVSEHIDADSGDSSVTSSLTGSRHMVCRSNTLSSMDAIPEEEF